MKPLNEETYVMTGANALLLDGVHSSTADVTAAPMQQAAQALQ